MVEQTDDRVLSETTTGDLPPGAVTQVMVCPVCAYENLMGADQCQNCGTDLRTSDIPHASTEFEHLLTQVPLSALQPLPCMTVGADTATADVLRQMRDGRQAGVVVVDGERIAGIFTERDALTKLAGRGPVTGVIRDVMTVDPVVLRADDSLAVAIQKMAIGGFRHIPIVDDGRPIGIVTTHDVLRHVLRLV